MPERKEKAQGEMLCAFFYEKRETGSYAIVPFVVE